MWTMLCHLTNLGFGSVIDAEMDCLRREMNMYKKKVVEV